MRALVTGGSGFIGRAVVAAALDRGWEVVVLDRRPDPAAAPGVERVAGELADPGVVARALDGVDVVLHQAARVGVEVGLDDLPRYVADNDLGTSVLLAAMGRTGIRHLVLAGSMVVYGEGRYACDEHGDVAAPPRRREDLEQGRFEPACPGCGRALVPGLVPEDAPPDPRSGYAATKFAQELLARVWTRDTGGTAAILRYHNVFGPGLPRDTPYAGVAALFGSALAAGTAPQVFEDGGQLRDFVHVADVAEANLVAAEAVLADDGPMAPGGWRAYNVASGTRRTILDLARAMATAVGGPAPEVTGRFRLGDVRHVTADTARIRSELGWRPTVPFEDGVARLATELATAGDARADQPAGRVSGTRISKRQPPSTLATATRP